MDEGAPKYDEFYEVEAGEGTKNVIEINKNKLDLFPISYSATWNDIDKILKKINKKLLPHVKPWRAPTDDELMAVAEPIRKIWGDKDSISDQEKENISQYLDSYGFVADASYWVDCDEILISGPDLSPEAMNDFGVRVNMKKGDSSITFKSDEGWFRPVR